MQPAGGPPTVPTTEYIICSGAIEIDAATSTWKRAKYPDTERDWNLATDVNPHTGDAVMFPATQAFTHLRLNQDPPAIVAKRYMAYWEKWREGREEVER